MESEQAEVLLTIARLFSSLGIHYHVGGSVASSIHGVPRFTQDIDVVAEMGEEHVAPLVAALESQFYIDAGMIRDAIKRKASFNVIHLGSLNKVDVFVAPSDPWAIEEAARRIARPLEEDADSTIYVASPEDTILHKLKWYRMGGGVSDRQWSDVLGVLRIQGPSLDQGYLQRWAAAIAVEDLLKQAMEEAGKPNSRR